MAAGSSQIVDLTDETDKDVSECAVCLQPYVYPAQLPCGHIFCFLCIKGTANQSKRCAMCRQEIPRDFIERPNLLKNKDAEQEDNFEGCYQWFYEGRNGWWQYDERTSKELEVAYKSGERTCELLIAGFLYVMDFDAMLQLRRTDPSRRRRMKRDLVTIDKKGIAGLRSEHCTENIPPPTSCSIEVRTESDASNSRSGEDRISLNVVTNARIDNCAENLVRYCLRSRGDVGSLEGSQVVNRCSPVTVDSSSDSDEDQPIQGERIEQDDQLEVRMLNLSLRDDLQR